MRLLVVEDESIVAQDVAWFIENIQGFKAAGTARTVAEALAFIKSEPIDGAVLDANLGSESSEAVAEELRRRKIPYFVLSGCIIRDMLPPPLNLAPLLEKPYRDKDLISQIRNLAPSPVAAE